MGIGLNALMLCLTSVAVKEMQEADSGGSGDEEEVDEEFRKAYPTKADPRDYRNKRTPEDVFKEFDADGSGILDLDEFIEMLPTLGIFVRWGAPGVPVVVPCGSWRVL